MARARKGYVYVLSNPSMPGIVKIGRSVAGGKSRARDMYQTGVPEPFILEFEVLCDDYVNAEAAAHDLLVHHRLNNSREFFTVDAHIAKRAVLKAAAAEFHHEIVHTWTARAWRDLSAIAAQVGMEEDELCWAAPHIQPESLKKALYQFGPVYLSEEKGPVAGEVH